MKFVHHPIAPVIEGEEDVVDVHDDARLETRQHFQKQVVDVPAYFHRMRTVYEQDVARLELREKFQIDILSLFFNQRSQAWKSFPKKLTRKWFDTDESRGRIFRSGFAQDERRETAADLDD